jgi:adenylate cyclase
VSAKNKKPPTWTLSLIDVLRGDVAEEDIKDKVIFIGSNSLDIEDHFVGQTGEKIPGVYVHASVFTTLLNNSFLQELNIFLYIILLSVLIAGLLYVVFKLKNIFLQGICLLGGALLIILITLIGFSLHNSISISTLIFPYIFISVYTIVFRYTLTERKNTYIKELFGQFVHPKVLANILKHNNLKLGGEKKYITILFSDIRGFTTMTEQMPAEELVETLNTYFEAMSPHIMDREGVIDKYIGDAIMAFWNAPVTVLHHEEKAVKAVLAMVDALKVLQDSTPLQIGIGLHAGEAVVGNIGSSKRINYTIIGDAVNACSRLEGLTKKYGVQIIVSEQIKNAVMVPEILWRSVDVVRVKGKSEVMKLYEPLKNTPENRQKRENSDKAFVLYQNSDFEGAHNLYKIENDMYSKKMCERCKQLVAKSPAHWTGVWDWDEK